MADEQQSSKLTESMVREIEELCDDSMFNEREGTRNQTMPDDLHEGTSSVSTTPDPLNTAFIINEEQETTGVINQGGLISLSQSQQQQQQQQQQQSQTTKETSSTISDLISRIIKQAEHPTVDLRTPTKTMVSTGTMTMTPTMISRGTMPRTPSSATSSTSANETIVLSSPSTPSTIDIRSPIVELIEVSSSPDTPTTAGNHSQPSRYPASQ